MLVIKENLIQLVHDKGIDMLMKIITTMKIEMFLTKLTTKTMGMEMVIVMIIIAMTMRMEIIIILLLETL